MPPHSPTPVRVLTVSGEADEKAVENIFLAVQSCSWINKPSQWRSESRMPDSADIDSSPKGEQGTKAAPEQDWLERSQPNALNLLRLVFAFSVIVAHAWDLGSRPTLIGEYEGVGGIAVNGFFAISGFLIVASWFSRSAEQFLRNRVVRILPGFAVALIVSLILASIGAGSDWLNYLRTVPPQRALVGIVSLDCGFLDTPVAFAHNAYPNNVNGSLWTVRVEFACYMGVAIAGSVGLLRKGFPVALFTAVSIAGIYFGYAHRPERVGMAWYRFGAYFGAGATLFLYRRFVPKSALLALLSIAVLATGVLFPTVLHVAMPIFGLYLIFYIAYVLPGFLQRIGSKNDISYGVYLYAFPLQQLYYAFAVQGLVPNSPEWNLAFASVASLICGWLSWKLVEQPCMRILR